ncbi:MAG: glycosyltransferase [Ginsengibacter sp.]
MRIYFTVTNDLNFDQRMIRICTSLAQNGFTVTLVGRRKKNSAVLYQQLFSQQRLNCFFEKGKLFYMEYNIRLFFFLLIRKMDAVCAIDLDSILPCYFISVLRNKKRVYDAHELFCEMKEIVARPAIYKTWKKVEKFAVPKFLKGYTVNQLLAEEFKKMYNVNYDVIRSITLKQPLEIFEKKEKYILYQGAVNEGRGFEILIPAMAYVDCKLIICGDGNFIGQAKQLAIDLNVANRVVFEGTLLPEDLRQYTLNAYIGITLFEKNGLSNYLSLANRFFDYMHAALPQVCMNFPLYKNINDDLEVAVLIDDLDVKTVQEAINYLLSNAVVYHAIHENCIKAREKYNWQNEEVKLLNFYKTIA